MGSFRGGIEEACAIPEAEGGVIVLTRDGAIGFGETGEEEEVGVLLPAFHERGRDDLGADEFVTRAADIGEFVLAEGKGLRGFTEEDLDLAGFGGAFAGDGIAEAFRDGGVRGVQDFGGEVVVVVEPVNFGGAEFGEEAEFFIHEVDEELAALGDSGGVRG